MAPEHSEQTKLWGGGGGASHWSQTMAAPPNLCLLRAFQHNWTRVFSGKSKLCNRPLECLQHSLNTQSEILSEKFSMTEDSLVGCCVLNTENTTPIVLGDRPLEEVDSFTYLGSNVDKQGGTDADIRIRIGKARAAFHQLRSVWRSTILSTMTKLRIFNSIVKPVLLYGAETWRTTVANTKKLQTFLNTCLRKLLKINWPDIISNQELWRRTNQQPIEVEILQRRWRWIGHTLRKAKPNITRESLSWNPQGRRKRGRPRNSWRRDVEAQMRKTGRMWGQLEALAQDHPAWRRLVDGLCPRRDDRPK